MLRFILVVCSLHLLCIGHEVPDFKFCISSKQNRTGDWYYEVLLDHKEGRTNKRVWKADVDHKIVHRNGSRSILIHAKIKAPVMDLMNSVSNVNSTASDIKPSLEELKNQTQTDNITMQVISNTTNGNDDIQCTNQTVIIKHPTKEFASNRTNGYKGYKCTSDLKFYKLYSASKTWKEARKTCEKDGSHLLVLNSEEEADKIETLIENSRTTRYMHWIGLVRQSEEDNFFTVENNTLESTCYINWHHSEPNNRKGENCGFFKHSYGMGDLFCTWTQPFICEVD
ncbi:hypothetical protein C0J52_16451 [Blattella germanica]|nr:hypothetical protein C0J52_16451 [Blattella germanica]